MWSWSLARDAALRLIGFGSDDDYRVTKTLQLVQSELGDSIGLLARGSCIMPSDIEDFADIVGLGMAVRFLSESDGQPCPSASTRRRAASDARTV